MDLGSIVKALNLKVKSGENNLQAEIRGGYTGDLLSDVMANSKEGDVWITRQVHQNIVAVASL
ncbi:MAG: serine kinase, partial [Syntrophales bacterium]